jgi:hypothetical protein
MPNAEASAQLREVALKLKAAGVGGLRVELLRGLRAGAKPLIPAVAEAARRQLPRAGGLNEQVAGQKVTVSVRTGATTAGVRLTTTAPDTKQTDSGYVRKPVFGHRDRWVTQQIPGAVGWWSATLANGADAVSAELIKVIAEMTETIQNLGF